MDPRPTSSNARPAPLLADLAYEGLRDRIVGLAISPGDPIDEEQVSRELGMGRTPVREAIKRLALENLVSVFPRRGTFASEINITDLAHISDVRTVLEGHAAALAAQRLADVDRPELEAMFLTLERERGSEDRAMFMVLDARVHRFIYRCAGNPYLAASCDRYFNLSLRIWNLALDRMSGLPSHVDEHRTVLACIAAGDEDGARTRLSAHILTFEQAIREVL